MDPPVEYETDEELKDICTAMAQMAPGMMAAGTHNVELNQSAENVIAEIEAATQEYSHEFMTMRNEAEASPGSTNAVRKAPKDQ
jgi:hypothetical protein